MGHGNWSLGPRGLGLEPGPKLLEAWGADGVELEAWSLELGAVWGLGLALGACGGARGSKWLGFMAVRRSKEASKAENCHFGDLSLCNLCKYRRKKNRGGPFWDHLKVAFGELLVRGFPVKQFQNESQIQSIWKPRNGQSRLKGALKLRCFVSYPCK